ncbi:alpha/beta-hydrolase [Microthyrium microscopicum]|uniref:Carboxylic ester hydrolase n=1 Tax=Microthyrium microscopicum TaxID=703497 RepID=A0A6A6UHD1_9PEZI|nr:alpha/beta-hydrolase [Microthyrium microscopicum]
MLSLAILVLFLEACLAIALTVTPRVILESGQWEGIATTVPGSPNTVHKFLGIRYGAAPVRFDVAKPAPPSKELKRAVENPPACIEARNSTEKQSEDCLFLNIYTPIPDGRNDRAVMIFLFGGGFQYGSASHSMYDGSSFAANQDVIIVVPNYRTNVFGFPGEAPGHPIDHRNLGLLDQHLAFDWVRKNIAQFGGDPKKVTLFGQSAGARAADFHTLTMANHTPFRAVIMESGSAELTPLADFRRAYRNTSTDEPFMRLCREVGCPTPHASIACMRQIPATKLKEGIMKLGLYFGSTFDNNTATVIDPAERRQNRRAANISLLMGTNANEQKVFVKREEKMTLEEYAGNVFGNRPTRDRVRELYKVDPAGSTNFTTDVDAIAALETDYAYTCLTSREANISATAGYPTWRYFFNFSSPNIESFPGSGAYHGAEIRFVFGNLIARNGGSVTETERNLSARMQKLWADFAKDPTKGPGWPQVTGEKDQNVGYFGMDGKLTAVKSDSIDRNCRLFQKMYSGRA